MNKLVVALSLSLSFVTSAPSAVARPPGPLPEVKNSMLENLLRNRLIKSLPPSRESANIAASGTNRLLQEQITKKSPSELAAIQQRSGFHYRYVALDPFFPSEFLFFDPAKILDNKRVYGTAYACDLFCVPSIATYRRGSAKILHQNAIVRDVNRDGIIAGSVVLDNENFVEQAALFDDGNVKLIPRVQGEVSSHVMRITDSRLALVQSTGVTDASYHLYKNGKSIKLNFGTNDIFLLDINDKGIISGTMVTNGKLRAFRFNPFAGKLTLLNPLATEPSSWGVNINNKNEVLGYSFVSGALERIGVWKGEKFSTYFVEGTPQFPTVSNRLLWNKDGLIVITFPSNDTTSYLVPKPGVRLNLADLVDELPAGVDLFFVSDINERGDLTGFDLNGRVFLLERLPTHR